MASRSWVRDCRHSAALLFVDARTPPLWIPAFARMTRWGGGRPAWVCRVLAQGAHKGHPYVCFGEWWGRRWALLGRPVWVRRAPRPGRFVNRPYSDVGGWRDAGGHYRAGSDAGGSDQLLLFRRLVTLVV